ncbi:MAG: hypothetical protein ABI858_00680 [Pseudoxanthomonas sp.]
MLAAMIASSLLGCRTSPEIAKRMIMPPGAVIMDIPEDQAFLMASPISQPMPVFPGGDLLGPSVSACVELVIDESGSVSSATPIYAITECPLDEGQMDQRLVAAVIDAVSKWQFLAAATCTFPAGAPRTEDCSGDNVLVVPVAIKLSYVFSFQGNGRVILKARKAPKQP